MSPRVLYHQICNIIKLINYIQTKTKTDYLELYSKVDLSIEVGVQEMQSQVVQPVEAGVSAQEGVVRPWSFLPY